MTGVFLYPMEDGRVIMEFKLGKDRYGDGFSKTKTTGTVLLDFTNALDSVWRESLLLKMMRLGLEGPLVRLVTSYCGGRFFRAEAARSSLRQICAGVPLDKLSGLDLFIPFTSNGVRRPGAFLMVYTSDTAFLTLCRNEAFVHRRPQRAVDGIAEWA